MFGSGSLFETAGAVPTGCNDGPGLCPDQRDHVVLVRLREGSAVCSQDGRDLQAVLRTAVQPGTGQAVVAIVGATGQRAGAVVSLSVVCRITMTTACAR